MLKKVFHKGQMPSPKRMNFWRSGVIFNPEIYDADRGPFEHGNDTNLQNDFKCHLELFRKFIRFGDGICPIVLMFLDHQCRQTLTFTSVVLCSATASLGCVEQPGDLNGSFLDILTWISILMFGIFIIWVPTWFQEPFSSPSISCSMRLTSYILPRC